MSGSAGILPAQAGFQSAYKQQKYFRQECRKGAGWQPALPLYAVNDIRLLDMT
jgi:hypothetical protein